MPRVIRAVPLFGDAFRLGLLVSVTVALGCDGKPHTQMTPPSQFGPAISSVTPATGSTSGATVVTIVGLRFQAGATVTFGGATATVSALSSTSITATTEGRTPGTVDVVVTNPDGQAATAAGRFTFTPPPFAASVYPHTGSTGGRTTVEVTGSEFQIGATVTLDGAPVSTFGRGTLLSFTTRAHAPGSVDVVVRNPDGQSVTLAGAYAFAPPETFDFNGDWFAYLGNGNDDPFSFTVEGNSLVSLTCYEGTHVTLPSPLPVSRGEVAASVNGIVIFSGLIVGPNMAVGTIDAGLCHSQDWSGWKDQQGTARLSRAAVGPPRPHK